MKTKFSEFIFEDIDEEDENKINPPRPYIMKIDVTINWREDVVEKAGKIYAIYLVDKNNTDQFGDIERKWFNNVVENIDNYDIDNNLDDEHDLSDIEIHNGGNNETDNFVKPSDIYIDCAEEYKITASDIENIIQEDYDVAIKDATKSKEAYNEFMDSIFEYYQGNHVF